jgi:hypothetical protein
LVKNSIPDASLIQDFLAFQCLTIALRGPVARSHSGLALQHGVQSRLGAPGVIFWLFIRAISSSFRQKKLKSTYSLLFSITYNFV